ncbi:MAG TPA: ABC transporter substrate-binding protein, partial [Megamonas hypermegale]|nr:ABC transporter substrate-binding protein [Megamonas hypermegale]
MNFGKKRLRMAGMLLGITMLGSVFAGCGGEEAANSNEIKVGANFEITGNVANYGTTARDGFKLAIKEANEAGGIDGKQIVIVEADNKSDPAESANAATKLISDDKVVAIVGPATSGAVQAESQIATENKIPIIAPCATSPDITVENGQVKEFVFRGCFIDPLQSNTMANFAANELKAKTAVIYLDSSTDYSKSLAEVFKNKFEALGGKVVMQEAFVAKDQDFKAALTNIKTANADVIYVPAYYEEVGKIVKQARELGITQPILGVDGWDDTKVVDIAGADALNNTYYVTHYIDTDPDVKAFVDSFTKEYGHAPGVFAALGYD